MIYIFLDIDGVITTPRQWDEPKNGEMPYPFDIDCVNGLIEIASNLALDAKWILSSDWRLSYSLEEIHKFFRNYGIPIEFIDTCKKSLTIRGELISEYIERNVLQDDTVIIIDDIRLTKYVKRKRKGAIFTTDENVGLADKKIVENIIKRIKKYYERKA